jgi:hypothetical protein
MSLLQHFVDVSAIRLRSFGFALLVSCLPRAFVAVLDGVFAMVRISGDYTRRNDE